MRTGTAVSGALHATLIALALFGDRLFPAPSRARVIEIPQVDLISGLDFDAALSDAPALPEGGQEPPTAPQVAAETTPPPAISESTRTPAAAPPPRPAVPPAPEPRVPAETAPDVPAEAAPAPRPLTPAPRTAEPVEPAAPPPPAPVARREPPQRQAPAIPAPPPAADRASVPPPKPEPEPEPEPEPDPEPVRESPPEPERAEAETPPAPPVVPMPTARPARPEPPRTAEAPETPAPQRPAERQPAPQRPPEKPAENPLDALVRQAQGDTQPRASDRPATAPAQGARRADRPLSGGQRSGLIAGIRRYFAPPEGISNAGSLSVTYLVSLDRQGRVTGRPELVAPAGALDAGHAVLARRALTALAEANRNGVFATLPPESYDIWRQLRVTFTPEDLIL